VAWGWGVRVSTGGPSWRMVIDMADVEAAVGVLPGGESGVPFSQHYTDQVDLWLNYRYHGLLFPLNTEELQAGAIESTIIFKPR
jgi:penicillin amidase